MNAARQRPARPATGPFVPAGSTGASRRRLRITGAVLAAGVLALVALSGMRSWWYSPGAAVDAFFGALADRDATAALALLDRQDRHDRRPSPLLANGPLRDKGYEPPSQVSITKLTTDAGGEQASAAVRFRVGGREHTGTFQLRRNEKSSLLLFHGWRITSGGLASVRVSGQGLGEVSVNGVALSDEDGDLPVLLGGYTARAAGGPLFDAPAVKVTAAAGADTTAELKPVLKAGVAEEASRQVEALIAECARSTEAEPPGCPFRVSRQPSVSWVITVKPQYTVQFEPGRGVVVWTSHDGTATASPPSGGRTQTSRFGVNGTVENIDGKVTYQYAK
ncbi:hypothetical protein [Longispora albida]|uniref:hypothetical protein n=1 Tax=Longispora albida TaxID=203523 RepID=UPI00039FCD03|nr:hypothetical protein [Longispora albida]